MYLMQCENVPWTPYGSPRPRCTTLGTPGELVSMPPDGDGERHAYCARCYEEAYADWPVRDRPPVDTVEDVRDGREPVPAADDVALFEAMHGDEGWLLALIPEDRWVPTTTLVPYGDTMTEYLTEHEPMPGAVADAIEKAWEDGILHWVRDDARPGRMMLAWFEDDNNDEEMSEA